MSEERIWSEMHAARSNAEGALREFIEAEGKIDSGIEHMAKEIADIVFDASKGQIKLKLED